MFISLSVFVFVYLVLLLFFCLFSLFNIYHLVKYGLVGGKTFFILAVYIAVSLLLIGGSFNFISQIDWSYKIEFTPGAGRDFGGFY